MIAVAYAAAVGGGIRLLRQQFSGVSDADGSFGAAD